MCKPRLAGVAAGGWGGEEELDMRSERELGVSGDKILAGFVSCCKDFGFNP